MYSSFSINTISIIISIILFSVFNFAYDNLNYHKNYEINQNVAGTDVSANVLTDSNLLRSQESVSFRTNDNAQNNTQENIQEISFNWGIYIPKINLNAQISEGTTKEVMDKYVGHFVDTAVVKGNVCLGAHNRGYPVNYFEKIKTLEKGDLIYYKKDDKTRKYIVEIVTIIKDTDWTYLENTEDNRITLITCVEDEPDYRRCIQAVEG